MLTTIIIVIALALLGYILRRNFRRFWHVLRTGNDNPDWEKLGADHYIADWERRFWKLPAGKKEAEHNSEGVISALQADTEPLSRVRICHPDQRYF